MRGFEWRWLWRRAQGDARRTFTSHKSWVNVITYSPDGRLVASVSEDGTAKIWDAAREILLRTVETPGLSRPLVEYTDQAHELDRHYAMTGADFSGDSRALLTCSTRTFNLWEPGSGRLLWSLGATGYFRVMFSRNATNLALATAHPSFTNLTVIDVVRRELMGAFTSGRADTVCFTPDGRHLARWDRSARRIWLQEFPSGETVTSLDTTGIYVEQMAFAPDGRTLAAANLHRGPIELFDVPSRRRAEPLVGHTGRCYALAVSPDGRWLASGGTDQTIRLWDLPARREARQLRGHRAAIRALAFSPDGRRLVSGGHDGTVRFWDVAPPSPLPKITNVFGPFAFSPDGRRLLTRDTNYGVARLWELPSRRVLREWPLPPFQNAAFTTNGTLLTASLGASNEPPVLRAFSLSPSEGERAEVMGLVLPDVNYSATSLVGIPSFCTAISLSPDGHHTATGHRDGTVVLWETRSGRLLHKAERALVASVGYGDRQRTTAAVNPLVFSPDSRVLAAISFDRVEVKTWTLPGMLPISGRFLDTRQEVPLAVSPDGRQLAMGGLSQGISVNLWDAAFRQPGPRFRGHHDFIFVVAYSPDGRTLASGGRDGQLKFWHLSTQRDLGAILELPQTADFAQVTFSPEGSWLGVSDTAGTLRLFHAPPLAALDSLP